MVSKMKAKRKQLKIFLNFVFKLIKTNSYKLKSLTRLRYTWDTQAIETERYQVYGVQQQKQRQT